ncbi:MAG: hypothetical protein ACRYG7_39475 [Janthinobacterium lividum]
MPVISTPTAPHWVGVQTLAELPAGLTWSGTQPVPAIGARVHLYLNSFGPAQVTAYFHADGYLGVVCAPEVLPAWFQQQSPGVREGHFFGIELEPFRPVPAASTTSNQARQPGQITAEQLAGAAHGLSLTEDTNAGTLAQLAASDWIPDYPPTDDRAAADDG